MIETTDIKRGYSSDVRLWLRIGSETLPLSKIGPGYLHLRSGAELTKGHAELIMNVDDREHSWSIQLLHDAVPFDLKIEFEVAG